MNIRDITPSMIDVRWLHQFIIQIFPKSEENITALKILGKLGVPMSDSNAPLHYKEIIQKLKLTLADLERSGVLEKKNMKHDTLGIKEAAYKLKSQNN